jgi:hypothetical protein
LARRGGRGSNDRLVGDNGWAIARSVVRPWKEEEEAVVVRRGDRELRMRWLC